MQTHSSSRGSAKTKAVSTESSILLGIAHGCLGSRDHWSHMTTTATQRSVRPKCRALVVQSASLRVRGSLDPQHRSPPSQACRRIRADESRKKWLQWLPIPISRRDGASCTRHKCGGGFYVEEAVKLLQIKE